MAWAAIDPDGKLAIGCSPPENGLCLQIPGCNLTAKDGIWRVHLSWPAWVAFRAVWSRQPVDIMPSLLAWEQAAWAEVQERYSMRTALDAPGPLAAELAAAEDGGDLHLSGPQRGAVSWLTRWRRVGYTDPQGNGKTPPMIAALSYLHASGDGCPALVVAPGGALQSWAGKIRAWAPDLRVRIAAGSAAKRKSALEADDADVFLIAWPNLKYHTRLAKYGSHAFVRCADAKCGGADPKITTGRCEVHEKELNLRRFQVLILDEAHRMADPSSKQTRAATWLAHHTETVWAATGTVLTDDIGSLWGILHALDPKAWPARSRYLDLFAEQVFAFHGGKETLDLRPDTAPYFHIAVDPMFRRIPRELARAGQPVRCDDEFFYPPMPHAQALAYKQVKRSLMQDLTGQTLVPGNSAVKFGRLVQLASSAVQLSDGESQTGHTKQVVTLTYPSSKAEGLVEFLIDNPGQWVVTCFSPDLVELCARKLAVAKITCTRITGEIDGNAQHHAAQAFQRGEHRVIFVTAAGAESIDLYAARGVIFLQPNPSYVAREQIIGRVDRWGQTEDVRVVYMVSPGTVDQRLYELAQVKERRADSVNQDAELMRWIIGDGEDEPTGTTAAQQV
jgi:SNF2-related domain/Helicase conserved C-terminal domain